jgi:toxin ParE1/3/4
MRVPRVDAASAEDGPSRRRFSQIWTYIARDNPAAADRLFDLFDEKSWSLAHNPQIGKARDDVAPGVRHFPVGRYLILYRDIGDGVEIVRAFTTCAASGTCCEVLLRSRL